LGGINILSLITDEQREDSQVKTPVAKPIQGLPLSQEPAPQENPAPTQAEFGRQIAPEAAAPDTEAPPTSPTPSSPPTPLGLIPTSTPTPITSPEQPKEDEDGEDSGLKLTPLPSLFTDTREQGVGFNFSQPVVASKVPTIYNSAPSSDVSQQGMQLFNQAYDTNQQQLQQAQQQQQASDWANQALGKLPNVSRVDKPWQEQIGGALSNIAFGTKEAQAQARQGKAAGLLSLSPADNSFGYYGAGLGGGINYILSAIPGAVVGAVGDVGRLADAGLQKLGVDKKTSENWLKDGFLQFLPKQLDFLKPSNILGVNWNAKGSTALGALTGSANPLDVNQPKENIDDPSRSENQAFYNPRTHRNSPFYGDPLGAAIQTATYIFNPGNEVVNHAFRAGLGAVFGDTSHIAEVVTESPQRFLKPGKSTPPPDDLGLDLSKLNEEAIRRARVGTPKLESPANTPRPQLGSGAPEVQQATLESKPSVEFSEPITLKIPRTLEYPAAATPTKVVQVDNQGVVNQRALPPAIDPALVPPKNLVDFLPTSNPSKVSLDIGIGNPSANPIEDIGALTLRPYTQIVQAIENVEPKLLEGYSGVTWSDLKEHLNQQQLPLDLSQFNAVGKPLELTEIKPTKIINSSRVLPEGKPRFSQTDVNSIDVPDNPGYSSEQIDKLASQIVKGGLSRPLILNTTTYDRYVPIKGYELEALAAKRAQEIDPEGSEMVHSFLLGDKPGIKGVELSNQEPVPPLSPPRANISKPEFYQTDVNSIEPPEGQPTINENLAHEITKHGLLEPIHLYPSNSFERYRVAPGDEFKYWAAKRAQEIDPEGSEMVHSFLLGDESPKLNQGDLAEAAKELAGHKLTIEQSQKQLGDIFDSSVDFGRKPTGLPALKHTSPNEIADTLANGGKPNLHPAIADIPGGSQLLKGDSDGFFNESAKQNTPSNALIKTIADEHNSVISRPTPVNEIPKRTRVVRPSIAFHNLDSSEFLGTSSLEPIEPQQFMENTIRTSLPEYKTGDTIFRKVSGAKSFDLKRIGRDGEFIAAPRADGKFSISDKNIDTVKSLYDIPDNYAGVTKWLVKKPAVLSVGDNWVAIKTRGVLEEAGKTSVAKEGHELIKPPDTLYHGSAISKWTPHYNLSLNGSRGELGSGLYTTSVKKQAEMYAKARMGENAAEATTHLDIHEPGVYTLSHSLETTLDAKASFSSKDSFFTSLTQGLPPELAKQSLSTLAKKSKATYSSFLNTIETSMVKVGIQPTEENLQRIQNTIADNLRQLGYDSVHDKGSKFTNILDESRVAVASKSPVPVPTYEESTLARYNADAYAAKYFKDRPTTDANLRDSAYKVQEQLKQGVDGQLTEVQQKLKEAIAADSREVLPQPKERSPKTVADSIKEFDNVSDDLCGF